MYLHDYSSTRLTLSHKSEMMMIRQLLHVCTPIYGFSFLHAAAFSNVTVIDMYNITMLPQNTILIIHTVIKAVTKYFALMYLKLHKKRRKTEQFASKFKHNGKRQCKRQLENYLTKLL